MGLKALIEDARKTYRASGVKLNLPQSGHTSTPGYVRLSAMDGCELQHAHEKLHSVPDFPELTPEQDPRKAWIMDHGNYVAPMIQEPLMYLAMTDSSIGFKPEGEVIDHALKAVGRYDGLLTIRDVVMGDIEPRILEIKDTEGMQKRSVGEPKLSYCLQALAYCMVTGVKMASIITVSKWGFNVYDLVPQYGGYRLQYEDGQIYYPPSWMDDFNDPSILNFDRVRAEIAKLHKTLTHVDANQYGFSQVPIPPIADPLNGPKSFFCAHHAVKPTKTKNGTAYANCPWIKSCHGWTELEYATEKADDGRYQIVSSF